MSLFLFNPGPHYVREIKNEALFLLLGLPFALICHRNGDFRQRSTKQINLKTLALRYNVQRKHFEIKALRQR